MVEVTPPPPPPPQLGKVGSVFAFSWDSLRPSTFSLLTLQPGLCGSLLTWTRQCLGAHAGIWVPQGLGSSHTFGLCGSKAFKTLSGSSKWTNYSTLRLSDWHKLSMFLRGQDIKKNRQNHSFATSHVTRPSATDVGHWFCFSFVRKSQSNLSCRQGNLQIPWLFFFVFCQKVTVSDMQLELQHDKSLAVSLLTEIWVISNVYSRSICSSLLWKHWIGNQQWCLR